jgi:phosphomannomutase
VRDKDGISGAAVFAELAAFCQSRGQSVLQYLEEIYRRFGLFQSGQHNVVLPGATGAAQIAAMMGRLRANPPKQVGKAAVLAVRDLSRGMRVSAEGEQPIDLPRSDVLTFELDGGGRITARPSGTEPKIKFYFELREQVAAAEALTAAQERASQRMKELVEAFVAIASAP